MAANLIRAAWHYRSFVFGTVSREISLRYQDSILGATWTILNPLAMILVYTVIFSGVMKSRLPEVASEYGYSIHLCAGILTWGLFSEIVSRSQTVFLDNANLIKKLNFPRICLPIVIIFSSGFNFLIIFSLFVIFLILSGSFPGLVFISILPILFVQILFSLGLGMILGVLNVFFRDVGHFFTVVMQFWFWLTPIVYPISVLSNETRELIQYNPMTYFVTSYQSILTYSRWPDWTGLMQEAVFSLILCLLGFKLFRTRSGEMVDEL